MKCIILAGGGGTRLRPLSQGDLPKQLIALRGSKTMLQKTIERLLCMVGSTDDIIISTSVLYEKQIQYTASEYGIKHIVVEPCKRNTAPAFGLIISYLNMIGVPDTEACVFFPADHEITPIDFFCAYIQYGVSNLGNQIMLFGIKPDKPETGYGYLQVGYDDIGSPINNIISFVEKPTVDIACQYLQSGQYFRNSGIFGGTLGTRLYAFLNHAPDIYQLINSGYDTMLSNYHNLYDISIDYAIMEKMQGLLLVPMTLRWSDLGSRDAVYDFDKDDHGNAIYGDWDLNQVHHSLLLNYTDKKIKIHSLDAMIIVITNEGHYISSLGNSQMIKSLL